MKFFWTEPHSNNLQMTNVSKIMISVFYLVDDIVGKGDDAGYQHFLLFPQCFQKTSSLGSQDCDVELKQKKNI